MPLYKYAPVVVVTALLFLSTFDSCDAGDIRLNKKSACKRSTQYVGGEAWQTFLTNNGFNNGNFASTIKGFSKSCFGTKKGQMKYKKGTFSWPCRGIVQDAVEKVQKTGEEKNCEYTHNNGKTMKLRIFKENQKAKFNVQVTSQDGTKKLDVPFRGVRASARRRRLLKSSASAC